MTDLSQFVVTVTLMAVSGGLGYYIGARGIPGVQIDLDNTKKELEKVKDLVSQKAIPQAVTIVTPVQGSTATNPAPIATPTHVEVGRS